MGRIRQRPSGPPRAWRLAALLLLAAPLARAGASYGVSVEDRAQPEAALARQWLPLRAEAQVRFFFGACDSPELVFDAACRQPTRVGPRALLPLPPATQDEREVAGWVRGLLWRRQLAVAAPADRAARPASVPDWLVAGLVHQTMLDEDAPAARPWTSFRHFLAAGRPVLLRALLDQPVAPSEGAMYRLYAEECAGVLRLLRGRPAEQRARLLAAPRADESPAAAGFAVLRGRDETDEDVQRWFDLGLRQLVFRLDQPGSYAQTRERFDQLQSVTLLVSDVGGRPATRRVPLDQVPAELRNYQYGKVATDAVVRDLLQLAQDSPVLLRPAIAAYVEAVRWLPAGQLEKFRQRALAARTAFDRASARGARISTYLDGLEQHVAVPFTRLAPTANQLAAATHRTTYEVRLDRYLDDLAAARQADAVAPAAALPAPR